MCVFGTATKCVRIRTVSYRADNVSRQLQVRYKQRDTLGLLRPHSCGSFIGLVISLTLYAPQRTFKMRRKGDIFSISIGVGIMTNDEIELHYATFLKALGQRIRQFRKARNLSLHDMVVKHGYHDSQWRRFERGGAANMLSLIKITRAFDVSLSELLDGLGTFPDEIATPETKKKATKKQATTKAKKIT